MIGVLRGRTRLVAGAAVVFTAVLSGCGTPSPELTTSDATAPLSPSLAPGEVPAPAQRAPSSADVAGSASSADAYSDPAAVTVVVNKRRPLNPIDYAPSELVQPAVALAVDPANATLRPDAAAAVEEMFAAAADDGVGLTLVSGYRSYTVQVDTYEYWVSRNGSVENADNYSARPGFSEHQTGLAFDIGQDNGECSLRSCFAETAAARWAAERAHEFGLILRYPEGRQETTGFLAESWHYRYVGVETSTAMDDGGVQTLEEFFDLPDAPDYG